MKFEESALAELRASVSREMSEKRFRHTAEVEKMAARLGQLYNPDKVDVLRAAALLHDITKEYSTERQQQICYEQGIRISKQDILTPKTFHAKTAAALIPTLYPQFADDEVISAVRWHTTGRANMGLLEKLVYLADYIDESRTFPDCVALREMFWIELPETMSYEERCIHLDRVLIRSFDMTIAGLIEDGVPISEDTFAARNDLIVAKY